MSVIKNNCCALALSTFWANGASPTFHQLIAVLISGLSSSFHFSWFMVVVQSFIREKWQYHWNFQTNGGISSMYWIYLILFVQRKNQFIIFFNYLIINLWNLICIYLRSLWGNRQRHFNSKQILFFGSVCCAHKFFLILSFFSCVSYLSFSMKQYHMLERFSFVLEKCFS